MTYTILSAKFANAEHSAAVITTQEAGYVLASLVDTPDLWPAVLAISPAAYQAAAEVQEHPPLERLRAFLRANPDIQAAL